MANKYSPEDLGAMSPKEFRSIVRKGEWTESNQDACRMYSQADLAVIPKEYAFDFLLFCDRNPRPCPVLDVTEPGDPCPRLMAPDADLRTDLPRYRVFQNGKVIDEPTDVTKYWRDDLVAFVIGCSRGFVWAFKAANVQNHLVGVYGTNIPVIPAGPFHGHMVCTCRAFPTSHDALRATQISSRHLAFHGPPVHIGDPTLIGIKNIEEPDVAKPPHATAHAEPHEILLFWGCGVTPQNVALESKVPFMITHYPSHMLVVDKLVEELAVL